MENLDFALQVLVLGFSVVMVTLFGLYGVLILFNRLIYRPAVEPAEGKATAEPAPARAESPPEENGRVVAAILAAVYQYIQGDKDYRFSGPLSIAVQPTGGGKGGSWKLAGRKVLLESSLELENIRRKKKRENI